MLILDWRHPSICCGSLGNIVSQALATEYIYDQLGQDIGVLIPEYHQDVWSLVLPPERIFVSPPTEEYEIRICQARSDAPSDAHWIQMSVVHAGFNIPVSHKVSPRICWLHSRNSRNVLLYPREYDNKNRYFTLDYWIKTAKELSHNCWNIIAILDTTPSHRDGNKSVEWCNVFKDHVNPKYCFPPTIGGLQAGIGLSSMAIGRFNGPGWLMLKSTIPQIVLDSPEDHCPYGLAKYNTQFITKPLRLTTGNSLDWINEL